MDHDQNFAAASAMLAGQTAVADESADYRAGFAAGFDCAAARSPDPDRVYLGQAADALLAGRDEQSAVERYTALDLVYRNAPPGTPAEHVLAEAQKILAFLHPVNGADAT